MRNGRCPCRDKARHAFYRDLKRQGPNFLWTTESTWQLCWGEHRGRWEASLHQDHCLPVTRAQLGWRLSLLFDKCPRLHLSKNRCTVGQLPKPREGASHSKSLQTFGWLLVAGNLTESGNRGSIHFLTKGSSRGSWGEPSRVRLDTVVYPHFPSPPKRSTLEIMITAFKLGIYFIENKQVPFKGMPYAPVPSRVYWFLSFLRILVIKP